VSIEKIKKEEGLQMSFKDQIKEAGNENVSTEAKTEKRIVGADVVADDWDKVLPLGLWDGLIEKEPIFDKNRKTGIKQLVVPLAVITENDKGDKAERKARVTYSFAPTAVGFTRELFDELAVEYEYKNGQVLFCCADFTNIEVVVEVYKNKQGYRNIKLHNANYKPQEE
jgi:hypothetical protein